MAIQKMEPRFSADGQFSKLLARRSDIDLPVAALELARDHAPQLRFDPTLQWIDARVDELQRDITRARSSVAALETLSDCLAVRHALGGDEGAFQTDDSSFLNRVIETKTGLPITLSLLYIAVGSRLGLDLYAVASPAHFLVGCQTEEEPLFLDAFSGGRLLDQNQTVTWLTQLTGWRDSQIERSLIPASPRHVIVRMLNNLKQYYLNRETWHAAWFVQERLAALHPGLYDQQRDLGILALKTGRASFAYDLLGDCIKHGPASERDNLQELRQQAQSKLAGWN